MVEARRRFIREAVTTLYGGHLIRKVTGGTAQTNCAIQALSATSKGRMTCRIFPCSPALGLGRVAAKYYVEHETAATLDAFIDKQGSGNAAVEDIKLLELLGAASEFKSLKVRDDEEDELNRYRRIAPHRVTSKVTEIPVKVALLVQMWLDRYEVKSFSLIADMGFIIQSFGRLLRAFSEIAFSRFARVSTIAAKLLEWSKVVEQRVWPHKSILWHFCDPTSTVATAASKKKRVSGDNKVRPADFKQANIIRLIQSRSVPVKNH